MRAKLFVNGFIIYWVFAIIGSNLYIGNTALSFGNISLIIVSFLIFRKKNFIKLSGQQKKFLIPLLLFQGIVTFYTIFSYNEMGLSIMSKFFYLSSIPLLYIIIFSLSNKYGLRFYLKIFQTVKFILLLLFVIAIIELTLKIHMPIHGLADSRSLNVPSAFFGNSNDFGVVTLILYLLFAIFNDKYGNRRDFIIFTGIVLFITIISISRTAFILALLFFPLYFIIVRQKSFRYVLITIIMGLSLLYVFNTVLVNYIPKKQLDTIGYINNRLLSVQDNRTYDLRAKSSVALRYEIYRYPFLNPTEFIVGHGLNGDEKILIKVVRWSGFTNAHSFFAETIYDFGWFGLLSIVWFFIQVLIFLSKNIRATEFRFGFILIIFFMALINVPSSIFGLPIIWAPLFIYLAYLTNQEKGQKESLQL